MNTLPSILLVEDDPGDVHLALTVFKGLGLKEDVCVVGDGEIALNFLHARDQFAHRTPGQPAVILLDLKLPRMDGFEVLEHVRKTPVLRLVPTVVLTSSGEERDLRRAYELGANAYVVKCIDFRAYSRSLAAIANFWLASNEPPPGSRRSNRDVHQRGMS